MTFELKVDLSYYFNHHLCPECSLCQKDSLQLLETREDYLEYVAKSNDVFASTSLPLCQTCWLRMWDTCFDCAMPIEHTSSQKMANLLLHHTTIVKEASQNYGKVDELLCQRCYDVKMLGNKK
jgi:hypothetical protein